MDWFDSYDFGSWAMVKYPDNDRTPRTPERVAEYKQDKLSGLWPAKTAEAIQSLRNTIIAP